ncbi:uncharacterized protein LOC128711755 [Anopheles marshallii]|uniref:uncharacterized protein LOC128711755 n=1 Tax=Anopheles marshallii TaxID=1521116 RepID=UPI00237A6285|nr:uncharacterized protein LOC128711755 [Anopheles marshallii]
MGYTTHPKRYSPCKGREKVMSVALLFFAGCILSNPSVLAITTTDALVEATHTTLPVTLGELETTPDHAVDLSEAETKDPTQRLEIIKQIRKVNQDGSYTVGYEAEDGTFKIESRDVLGNIKGTYGYIDANGDIKRVSYGGQPTQTIPMVSTPPTTEEEIVHIPPRFNRTQHLLMPTTRRPPNYHPPQQLQHHQHLHHNPQHASTLRPSVIQTIPRKRHGYSSTSTTATPMTSTSSTTLAMNGGGSSTSTTTTTTTTTESTVTSAATETGGHLAASFGEPTAASTHTSTLHTKPGTLLIIRPTPLPYQAGKTAEQLARPERLEAAKYTHAPPSKKPVRGNFLRRQLAPAVSESGEQYEAQPQQIIYGQSAADGELSSIFAGGAKPLYTTHPTPRIPAAVLAARQRAAHIQSVLQAQSQPGQGGLPERLTTERVYVKQPPRPQASSGHRHEPAPILYETSTEPSSEHSYVTDGPASSSVVQIPAANRVLASEAEAHAEERRPIFRPRPIEFRPRDDSSSPAPGRFRTPYGLPPPYARSFTPLPPPQESPYGGRVAPIPDVDEKDREADEPQQQHLNSILPYRQQRRLNGGLNLSPGDAAYQQQQPLSATQQQQNSYPVPLPYNPGQYPPHLGGGGRIPSNPYYYDIPPERPLTARDFERILQVLIFRHQQQQVAQQVSRYRLGGGYGGYNGGFPYNPYFPGPSPSPYGLGGPYLGGGYPQQQIPRPPLPFPYGGGPYDGQGYQNPLYSPSAPSANVRGGVDGGQSDADGGYGTVLPAAARRNGQYYQSPLDAGSSSTAAGSLRSADYLPPEVRESLLYRMLMLAIQGPGSGEVLPLAAPTGPSNQQLPLHHLQGASSMPRPQTQPNHRDIQSPGQGRPDGQSTVTAAATMLPMYSKKPVRSVQILGEE